MKKKTDMRKCKPMNNITTKQKSEDKYKRTDGQNDSPRRRKMRRRDNKDDQVTSHAGDDAEENSRMKGAKK